ncbi:MAG: serine/threonine-protein kinase [Planctomycetota bacterium]|nr:serine/threonine-protein kinase [Planctomycetota bacterium]
MSEVGPDPSPEEDPRHSDADRRMAELLRGGSGTADLRRALEGEDSAESTDVLSRLNALDFVEQIVGSDHDLPERIGGYEIKGLLGRGGMGTVYLCWQRELEREVALKVLSREFTADPTMRKRFRAEARATAALHHRHIVPIYDYGEAQGMLFFAMESVDGMSLDKHVSTARRVGKQPMEPLEAARRFAGVADALGLAHRRRLLHRDVKPGNILVAADGTLALTDFGLAKALDRASAHVTSKDGGFLGTLHYASPEQALGRELTAASDLYSLGVTMFEAVSGQLPIAGKSTEALLQSILYGQRQRLRDFISKPPRDLEAVLDKLLSREERDRYQDGEALARDLLRIADGEPVHIRRIPLHVRAWRRARKNPLLAGALLAVGIFLIATLALLSGLIKEQGRGRESRYENQLVAIERSVSEEPGSPWGPRPLFSSLTGTMVPDQRASEQILATMAAASEEMPDDERVEAMRAAYESDPSPEASLYLEVGRGFEARRLFDEAIVEAVAQRAAGDPAADLRLYRLYLGRGVAELTASVALPDDARTDLELASFLRPGAAFPLALLDMLEVVQSEDVAAAVTRLRDRMVAAPPERAWTVGMLLWSASGFRPIVASNLMDFDLEHGRQRAIHELAVELLDEQPDTCVPEGAPTGLAAKFAELCGRALGSRADPAALRSITSPLASGVESAVRPGAAMNGWRFLPQLISRPGQRGPLLDQRQEPLSAELQLATWRCLLALEPKSALIQLWLGRFDEFRSENPGLRGVIEVAARMHLLAASDEARFWADRWVATAGRDPAALLCRMQVNLVEGLLPAAQDDAIAAVQRAIEPTQALRQVIQLVEEQVARAAPGAAAGMAEMAASFRDLLAGRASAAKGGR